MENHKEVETKNRIRELRRTVQKTFLLLFVPHLLVCVLTNLVTTSHNDNNKYQSIWFLTYFSISLLVYILAPKIIKRSIEKERVKNMGNGGKVEEPKIPEPTPEPKPTTRKAVMELLLVNNKTDKEYTVKSENDFGLKWEYVGGKENKYELLAIQQNMDIDGGHWIAVARFVDFSIVKSVWQTFGIIPDEKTDNGNYRGWISVLENPPKIIDGNSMSDEFLCVNDCGLMMVASLFMNSDCKYTGFQKSGSSLNNVTHYMKLPAVPKK